MLARSAERRTSVGGRRRLDHVLAVAPNAIMVIERDGRCAYLNSAAASAIGIDAAAVEGRSLFDPGLPPQLVTVIAKVVASRATPAHGELELPTPAGPRRFEYFVTALGDDGSLVVSLRDAAPAPAPSEAAGARGPGAGQPELAARLRQSCHDLRTRLTVMLNWGLILGRQESRAELVQQGAAAIVASGRRMGELIDALAAMADEHDPARPGDGGPAGC